eukprot:scaffold17998_cov30-Tisochrysis_lutea.AAC.5
MSQHRSQEHLRRVLPGERIPIDTGQRANRQTREPASRPRSRRDVRGCDTAPFAVLGPRHRDALEGPDETWGWEKGGWGGSQAWEALGPRCGTRRADVERVVLLWGCATYRHSSSISMAAMLRTIV